MANSPPIDLSSSGLISSEEIAQITLARQQQHGGELEQILADMDGVDKGFDDAANDQQQRANGIQQQMQQLFSLMQSFGSNIQMLHDQLPMTQQEQEPVTQQEQDKMAQQREQPTAYEMAQQQEQPTA